MRFRKSVGSWIFDVGNILFMVLMMFVMLYPFLYVLAVSVSDPTHVANREIMLLPKGFDILAYRIVFSTNEIPQAFLNSVYFTIMATVCTLLFTSLTAYPLSQARLKGKGIITFVFALTMFLPTGMVPMFLLIQKLRLMNTVWALVLPSLPAMWNIIIMRTYFHTLPEGLIESAYIDGASDWRILAQIVIPLSKPILATIGLFAAVGMWNNFFGPLLYINDQAKYPLSIVLRRIVLQGTSSQLAQNAWMGVLGSMDFNVLRAPGLFKKIEMATIIVTVGPILVVYPFVQKYFVKGALVGSIKG